MAMVIRGRCMNVVEKLAEKHTAKMTYYLTKFDTAGDEVDRTNVVSQIVQELQGRVKATQAQILKSALCSAFV